MRKWIAAIAVCLITTTAYCMPPSIMNFHYAHFSPENVHRDTHFQIGDYVAVSDPIYIDNRPYLFLVEYNKKSFTADTKEQRYIDVAKAANKEVRHMGNHRWLCSPYMSDANNHTNTFYIYQSVTYPIMMATSSTINELKKLDDSYHHST